MASNAGRAEGVTGTVEVARGSLGFVVAECRGELSDEVRQLLLAMHGAAGVEVVVSGQAARRCSG
ncbi:hypothetical protein [Streptomyces sp. NPDC057280]|uniref:hypothetical protein n=1 Tax=Streptomyces sp. NPDC057280 TaxID=3346081 RepID=UPI00363B34F4